MARMDDKEFALKFELKQLQVDRNRLERIKERTDEDLDETRQRIRVLKKQLEKLQKPEKKKAAPKKKKSAADLIEAIDKNKKTFEAEDVEIPEESEVKIDVNSMTAIKNSTPVKTKKKAAAEHTVELKEEAEVEKTDSAE